MAKFFGGTVVTFFCVALTIAVYIGVRWLFLRYRHPAINVVGISAAIIIAVLLGLGIPHAAYAPACDILTTLLGAATVALAFPLYNHRHLLRRSFLTIILGVGAGSFMSMTIAGLIAHMGGLPKEHVVSILPKGASMPFAIELAAIYGGDPGLVSAFVVATGTLGSLLGAWLLTAFRVKSPFVRGLTLGTVAHAQGAGQALSEGEQCGAMAGLAMILGGIFTVAMAPAVIWLLGL